MPLLQTLRAPIISSLLISFFLLLILSPYIAQLSSSYPHHLPLNHQSFRSQQHLPTSFPSADTHAAIDILKKDHRVVCRVYRACRLRDHLLLPAWMKPYAHLLYTQCGFVAPLIFSTQPSLNDTAQSYHFDWIAPNTSPPQIHTHVRNYLPLFYPPRSHAQHLHNSDETPNINRTCFSPSGVQSHPLSSLCRYPPELTIPHPAIILDHQTIHYNTHQPHTTQLVNTYAILFGVQLQVFHSEALKAKSDTTCFRSIISSPPKTSHPSHEDASTRNVVSHAFQQDVPSLLENLFNTIANRLQRNYFDHSSVKEKKSIRSSAAYGYSRNQQFNQGTIEQSDALNMEGRTRTHSLRKLLGDKPLSPGSNVAESGTESVANGKDDTAVVKQSVTSLAGNGSPVNVTANDGSVRNYAMQQNAINKTGSSNSTDPSSQDVGRDSLQETITPYILETSDEGDLEKTGDEYLPTFQYLLDFHPDT